MFIKLKLFINRSLVSRINKNVKKSFASIYLEAKQTDSLDVFKYLRCIRLREARLLN